MRTIKRKRIFGGGKSIHKKKHKRSLKKFRGGVELNYLQKNLEIYKVKGILGHQKPGPLYKDEDKYGTDGAIKSIIQPTKHNLFKGNIKHDNGAVILTDYKPLKSIKIGWIYGGHFGNIVIYSSANKLDQVIGKINPFLFKKGAKIVETLFVREIDEEVIKFCENNETLKKEISPWEGMTQEFDFVDSDLDGDIDEMFKSILIKYYEEKINGISKEKIKKLLDSVTIDVPQMAEVRKSDSLEKYKNILQRRNKSFVKQFIDDCISDEIPTNEEWNLKIPDRTDRSKPIDDLVNYPDIYKKINALRLKQEMIYKESTDIFSIYISTHTKEIIPFNIEYFLYDVSSNLQSNGLIDKVIKKFNQKIPLFNNRCYKCISKIMYILQLFNPNDQIYRNSDGIVRYKKISDTDFRKGPEKITEFFTVPPPPPEAPILGFSVSSTRDNAPISLPGFRDFLNGYVINSLIDPVIMARLLSFNIQIKATILLSCINDPNTSNNYSGNNFKEIITLDVNHKSELYKSIDDDDLRLKIKRLKINDKEITDDDLVRAKNLGTDQSKVTEFAKLLDGDSDIVKSIECELEDPESEEPIITLKCECKIYRKDYSDKTNIMIYLFGKNEQSNFNQDLISKLLDKSQQIDNIYNINDEYLDLFDKHLLGDEDGHEHVHYDLIL